MNKRLITLIEIIVIIIIVILSVCFKFYPEYKNNQGSSDSFLDIENYKDIVEVSINEGPNFALITNNNNEITSIFFFDNDALCLYNKNIEKKEIPIATKEIVKRLIQNNYLKQNDTITITKYKNTSYQDIKKNIQNELERLQINVTLLENENTLIQKGEKLELTGEDDKTILRQLNIYSKDIVRKNKNSINKKDKQTTTSKKENLTEKQAQEYIENVYKKIDKYIKENNIINQEINSNILPITLIPADQSGTLYPSEKSWYYIENGKIYAYININATTTSYSYCYQGSINIYKKGEC